MQDSSNFKISDFPELALCPQFHKRRPRIVVPENLSVVLPTAGHDGRPNLTQSDTVAPALAVQHKRVVIVRHLECGTVKVRTRQGAADFEFLANDKRHPGSTNPKLHDAPGRPVLERLQRENGSDIFSQARLDKLADFLRGVADCPPIEVAGFLVKSRENLRQ